MKLAWWNVIGSTLLDGTKWKFCECCTSNSTLCISGYRLMPPLTIYTSLTTLRFITPALDAMHKDLKSLQTSNSFQEQKPLQLEKISLLKIFIIIILTHLEQL